MTIGTAVQNDDTNSKAPMQRGNTSRSLTTRSRGEGKLTTVWLSSTSQPLLRFPMLQASKSCGSAGD